MREAIVVAAGRSERIGEDKIYISLKNRPLIYYTLNAVSSVVNSMILVCSKDRVEWWRKSPYSDLKITPGGERRQDSVWAGLELLDEKTETVVVHDGARPLVKKELIEKVVEEAEREGAAILGVPATSTVKVVENGWVKETLKREDVWLIQTPQAFKKEVILYAYRLAYREGFYGTDCASLVERAGFSVKVLLGDERNIKVTTSDDLPIIKAILDV
jgi:2-C-methyl-D-erythritol 4-phosphate cytidylyltransferase